MQAEPEFHAAVHVLLAEPRGPGAGDTEVCKFLGGLLSWFSLSEYQQASPCFSKVLPPK